MLKTKAEIREKFLSMRELLKEEYVKNLSQEIINSLKATSYFKNAKTIMTYISYPNEVQTDQLVDIALKEHKTVAVPVCQKENIQLLPSTIKHLNQLEVGYFGLREPKKEYLQILPSDQLDLVIVPGVAFNQIGNRIGHGIGYYDNFLKNLSSGIPKIALAFDYQIIDEHWLEDPWDIPMDVIITESGIRYQSKKFPVD